MNDWADELMNDWADTLIEKKRMRGEDRVTAQELRYWVSNQCESNIERWQGEREYKEEEAWTAEELEVERHKETNRLIKLQQEIDAREQLVYDYAQNGIDIRADHSQVGKVASVRLPFTDEEWIDLLNKEGEYLSACCADISRIRDILQRACRDDHFIEVEEFYEAVFLAKNHGWKDGSDPIARMIALWDRIEPDARERDKTQSADLDDPKHALEVLYSSSGIICWEHLYTKESKDRVFDSHMNQNYALATIEAAVRTLFFKLKEMNPGPIEGYALVREDGEVGHTSSGLAVYRTQEFAQSICDRWNKEGLHVFTVKKARVSMEHGFQILPDDHEIVVTKDVANTSDPTEITF